MIKIEAIILMLSLFLGFAPYKPLPAVDPAQKYDIPYPIKRGVTLPYPLYISDLLPVGEEDGLLMIGSTWSSDGLLDRQVMVRLSKNDSLRWYYASEISSERKEWNDPVSLGGDRFAVMQSVHERSGLTSHDILVIDNESLAREIPLEKSAKMDFSYALFAAPNGFYLSKTAYMPDETLPNVITFYDSQGDERFVTEMPDKVYVLSILGLNDGALLVAVTHQNDASYAVCIRLDSSGEIIWGRAADQTNHRYSDAVLAENGDFLVIGEIDGNVATFLLDQDGRTYSNQVLLQNPTFYKNYNVWYGETVATPEGYAIRQSVFSGASTQRILLIDRYGNPLGYKYFKEEDGLDRFLVFLLMRDDTLCIGSHGYIGKNYPLGMTPVEVESTAPLQ